MWAGMMQGSISNGRIQEGNKKLNEKRIHPTQKPVQLYKWLLQNYAKPGDKILDTHVGSASSLIAFEEMGFDYVGFEIDSEYYQNAVKRINTYRSQLKLF
jgi:site-specific DNA-methyltransferase (adenine-specific)